MWMHNAATNEWQHPVVEGSGRRIVSTGGHGKVVVFESLDAANARAAAVFADMQARAHHVN